MPPSISTNDRPSSPGPLPLTLEPVVGPVVPPVVIEAGKPVTLGRSSMCQVILADEAVSRRHAQVHFSSGTWFITDLGSRHGTQVNALQLAANGAAPLHGNDLVGIGPWTFRVRTGEQNSASHITTDDAGMEQERVERIREQELAAITQNRLTILMRAAAEVAGATDVVKLAKVVVAAAIEGTGFPRAALLRDVNPAANELEIVCERGPQAQEAGGGGGALPSRAAPRFSTSLIKAARQGDLARLTADAPMAGGASIISLGIQTAMCAPIVVGNSVGAFLYLDARAGDAGGARQMMGGFGAGARGSQSPDAAAFCMALAKMYGMAMGNILREQLAERQRKLEHDLNAAHLAQKTILPPERGTVGSLRYAMKMRSGRYVAGDLFGVTDLGDGKVAVFLGDVAGKGISAAILMATAQTHLQVSLQNHVEPEKVISVVNRYLCPLMPENRFITLWLGIIDTKTGVLRFVDAGHGHWFVAGAGSGAAGGARQVEYEGGLPLGIDPDFEYTCAEAKLERGRERLILFSDGLIEQPNPEGQAFTLARAMSSAGAMAAAEAGGCSVNGDVEMLFDALVAHAGTDALADDTTIASVEIG